MRKFLFTLFIFSAIMPAHAGVRQSVDGIDLTLISPLHSKDQFKYSRHQEGNYTELKELIAAGSPNISSGSRYVWQVSSEATNGQVRLEPQGNAVVIARNEVTKQSQWQTIAIVEPIIFWDREGKEGQGQLSVAGNLLTVRVMAKSSQYPLRIDPTLRYGQWLGGNGGGPAQVNAVVYNAANSNIDLGGIVNSEGNINLNITMHGTYGGGSEGFVLEVEDGGTPSLVWGQWLGGVGDDAVSALAVDGAGTIYAGGYSTYSTGWDTVLFFGSQNGGSDGFVVNIAEGGTPSLKWLQWLGGTGNDTVTALAANGATVYAGGISSLSTNWETTAFFGPFVGLNDGYVVNITDGGSPSLKWVQWLGGFNVNSVEALAVNGTSVYAGGYTTYSTSWETVTFQGVFNSTGGTDQGWVVNISDGGSPSLKWGQWLGGTTTSVVTALAVHGSTIYAGGYTASSTNWETTAFFGTYSGLGTFASTLQGFVVNIAEGGTPCLVWGQWLGGEDTSDVTSMAVNGNTIYAAGYTTMSSSWQTTNYFGATEYGEDGYVANITDGGSPTLNWVQWLGGNGTDTINALAVNGTKIWAGGWTVASTLWQTVTFQGTPANTAGFLVEMTDGGSPSLKWGQWLGATQAETYVEALAVNGASIYAGGYTSMSTDWTTVAFHGTYGGGNDGFVVNISDGGTPSLKWGQWLGGSNADDVYDLAVNGPSIYTGGYSASGATNWDTVTFQGGYPGAGKGFVVKMAEGGTPSLNWGQWLGGTLGGSSVEVVAINGTSIYAAGYSTYTTGWTTVVFQGAFNDTGVPAYDDGFVVNISDGGTPSLKWGQWLGGAQTNVIEAMVVNGASIYVGGYTTQSTNWTTMAFQGVYNSTSGVYDEQGFVVNITEGGTPSLKWGQWLGGETNSIVYALAVNGASVYAGGYSSMSTDWTTLTFNGNMQSSSTGFIVNITEGGTPGLKWGQWLGGTGSNYVYSLAVNGSTIYAGGISNASTSWDAVTFLGNNRGFFQAYDNYVISMNEGGTPALMWGQWIGGNGTNSLGLHALALNVGIGTTEVFVGGYMYQTTNLETTTFQGVMASNWNGFVARIDDSAVSASTNNNNGIFFDTGF